MGETLADIERHDRAQADGPKLVVRHTGDNVQHRSKVVIDDLDFFYGQTQALKHVCLTLPEH